MNLLEEVWHWIAAALLALLAAEIVRRVERRGRSELEIAGTKARLRTWALVLGVFAVLTASLGVTIDFATRELAWRSVGRTDDARFVFLVSEFSGAGGADASSRVRDGLSETLGNGVQVLRVPLKTEGPAYGDVETRTKEGTLASGRCLERVKGDVVVWGEYHQSSDVATLAHSVKGESCLQAKCGLLVVGSSPTSVRISGIGSGDSRIRDAFLRSAVSKVVLPLQPRELSGSTCLRDREALKSYRAKTQNLLKGLPHDTPASFVGVFNMGLGIFELRLAELDSDERLLDQAIKSLEIGRAKDPASAPGYAVPYAEALVHKMLYQRLLSQRQTLAARVDAILPPTETDEDGLGVRRELAGSKGNAWQVLYLVSDSDADLQRAAARFTEALELSENLDERLRVKVALAELYLIRTERHPSSSNYGQLASALNAADLTQHQLGQEAGTELDPNLVYGFHGLRLRAGCMFPGRERLARFITEANQSVEGLPTNWANPVQASFRASRADGYACLFRETGDQRLLVEAIEAQRQLGRQAPRNSEQTAAAENAIATYRLIAFEKLRTPGTKSEALRAFQSAIDLHRRRGDGRAVDELQAAFKTAGLL